MGESSVGLKSLHIRLQKLEEKNSVGIVPEEDVPEVLDKNSFYDKMKNILAKNREEKQMAEMDKIKCHFDKGLKDNVKDINFNCFSYIVEYTVHYIEQNIAKISDIMNSDISSDLKLKTAISFILEYFSNLEYDFIVNSIDHQVKIIFNNKKDDIASIKSVSIKRRNTISTCLFKKQ